MKMNYSSTKEKEILIITLEGDLIGEDSGVGIIDIVNGAIQKKVLKCIVNIADVRYINSSGMGVLITVLTKFRNKGGEVYLVEPSENVKKLLIITKLNAIFNVSETIEEAQNKLKKL